MKEPVVFGVFDRESEVDISARNLPHWFQPGVAMFITFRTGDSMPKKVIDAWRHELCRWLCEHGVDTQGDLPPDDLTTLPVTLRSEYRKLRSRLWHGKLDAGHGECVLRNREGAFWQSEPFDHLVRSGEQFAYLQRYIARNGKEANLPTSNYLYWNRG
jgi:putative transposase